MTLGATWLFFSPGFCRGGDQVQGHPRVSRILAALEAGNRMFHVLYESGLWMTPAEGLEVAKMGLVFVRIYAELAHMSFQVNKLRFPMVVKLHMCDHTFRRLLRHCRHEWILNPLAQTTQADEVACLGRYLPCLVRFVLQIVRIRSGLRGPSGAPISACICDYKCLQDPSALSRTS